MRTEGFHLFEVKKELIEELASGAYLIIENKPESDSMTILVNDDMMVVIFNEYREQLLRGNEVLLQMEGI